MRARLGSFPFWIIGSMIVQVISLNSRKRTLRGPRGVAISRQEYHFSVRLHRPRWNGSVTAQTRRLLPGGSIRAEMADATPRERIRLLVRAGTANLRAPEFPGISR